MDPYTKDTLPASGGYTPASFPARPAAVKPPRRSLGAVFKTDRRVRYLAGAVLVAAGAIGAPAVNHLLAKPQPRVLVASRALPAGHVIAPGDLTAVAGAPASGSVIRASGGASMLGRQVSVQIPAGAVVAPEDFGAFPPVGMSVVPVAVKPGQYPPTLRPGDPVAIFPTQGNSGTTAQPAAHAAATARVVQLQGTGDSDGTVVVLLEASIAQAPVIAQAPGVVLVALDAQGDAP